MYELLEGNYKGCKYLYSEAFINLNNEEFTKYCNNNDIASPEQNYIAFSHFTHAISNKCFMVVDL